MSADQRHHERRHAEPGDGDAVEEADERAQDQHRRGSRRARRRDGLPGARRPRPGRFPRAGCCRAAPGSAAVTMMAAPIDADEAHDRALGEVDAADDDDERLPHAHRQERPDVGQLVRDVARVGEAREEERQDDEVGDAEVEDEVVGQQDPPQEAAVMPHRRRSAAAVPWGGDGRAARGLRRRSSSSPLSTRASGGRSKRAGRRSWPPPAVRDGRSGRLLGLGVQHLAAPGLGAHLVVVRLRECEARVEQDRVRLGLARLRWLPGCRRARAGPRDTRPGRRSSRRSPRG